MSTTTVTSISTGFTGLATTRQDGTTVVEIVSTRQTYRAQILKSLGGRRLRWVGSMPPSAGVQVARQIARIR